jgi:hypothetical protein
MDGREIGRAAQWAARPGTPPPGAPICCPPPRPRAPQVFKKDLVKFADREEYVVKGGRDKYGLLPKAFEGIKTVGVIGWGSQAPAQAQNMRESFADAGMDVKVAIGLRPDSPSVAEAEACGFSKKDGTLGDVFDVISNSDLVVLLISDAAQVRRARRGRGRGGRGCLGLRAAPRRSARGGPVPLACGGSSSGVQAAAAAARRRRRGGGGGCPRRRAPSAQPLRARTPRLTAPSLPSPPNPQAKLYPRVLAAMKPGATLGLSHGFLLGVMQSDGVDFRKDVNVVLVAPKVGGVVFWEAAGPQCCQ